APLSKPPSSAAGKGRGVSGDRGAGARGGGGAGGEGSGGGGSGGSELTQQQQRVAGGGCAEPERAQQQRQRPGPHGTGPGSCPGSGPGSGGARRPRLLLCPSHEAARAAQIRPGRGPPGCTGSCRQRAGSGDRPGSRTAPHGPAGCSAPGTGSLGTAVPDGPPRDAASPPPSPAGAAPALSHVGAGAPRAPAALLAPGSAEAAAGAGLAAPLLAGLAAARPDRRCHRGHHGGAAGAGVRRGGRAAPAGFLLDFISCPVIKGFTSAASITISFNQVKNILGLHGIPRQFFLQVYETLRRIGETRPGDAILGLTCLAALAGLRAMKSRLPPTSHTEPLATRASYLIVWTCATARNALVVLFAGLVAYCFQLRGSQPLTLTGSIPQGLPPCRLPPFSKAEPNGTVPFGTMVEDMGVGLAVVPLMGLVETVAIAKAFASQNDYRIDPNQELLAMGFANVLGSFFSSYPITGSFGRWVAGWGAGPGLRDARGAVPSGGLHETSC
uniref:Solute carrier family 26 member 11 n=1 Tax=Anas platyrhynchos platyrhynchos TaxID=8840 RepID=A0A493TWF4_ANAPP